MRTTIDTKIVDMKFNNEQFEKNVAKTMSSLDKLKEKLKLNEATKGFEQLTAAANKFNLTGVANTIDTIRTKFSAMEVVGLTAITKIANKAITAGGNIVSALTIDPMTTGFNEYETKINAIQTIMSNTASKGTTMADVTETLDELNTYADKTIYNFAEMTRNIGTFTAAGIGLKESATSIQGIANLAAASGSTSQQASTAMYQLSQAMAAGTVKLMDWNSVVNAGMGGEKFQEALKATAREHGVAVDTIIKNSGSFRESLQEGWITAEILNETLNKFTVKGATEYAQSMMNSGKWTQAQADALIKEAQAMEDAATKVKTFTQLWSTLKESAQSGWAQSWELIIGNFEEARDLLTNISDTIGGVINRTAESRNAMLKNWKDLGGRQHLVDALTNSFEAIGSIVKPISEAFREIFPPMTAKQLLKFTEGLKNLTARLKISDTTAEKLKTTFKGVFAVIDVAITVVSKLAKGIFKLLGNFTGLIGPILTGTSTLGEFASNMRDSIEESNFFGKAIDKLVGFLQNGINKVKEFGSELKEGFKADGYEGFVGFLKGLWEFVSMVGDGIMQTFGGIGQGLANMFGKGSFSDLVNSGVFTALLVDIFKGSKEESFLDKLTDRLVGDGSALAGVTNILNSVKDCFKAYQEQLKAGTLMKIATAIGILAASIFVVSTIDAEKLGTALGAMSVLFVELIGSMALFSKIPDLKGTWRAIPLMLGMSTSLLLLSASMRIIGSLNFGEMITGLVGVAGGIGVLVGALHLMPKQRKFQNAAKAIRSMSISLLILAGSLKVMASMSWMELGRGLAGTVVGLAALVGALHLMPKKRKFENASDAIRSMSISLLILSGALKVMASMSWMELGRGLTGAVVGLGALVGALHLMPKDMKERTNGMLKLATSLVIMAGALKLISSISWEGIGKIFTILAGSLAGLAIVMKMMKGKEFEITGMLSFATGLLILAGALKVMGSMSWEGILKSLLSLAVAFGIFAAAATFLAPISGSLLAVSGSFALFGLAAVVLGAGLAAVAAGITLLGTALAAGATGIVAGLTVLVTGILQLVPAIIKIIGDTLIGLAVVIGEAAPTLVESLFKLLVEVMRSLAEYTPLFAGYLIDFVVGILDVATEKMPELVSAVSRFVQAFFGCVADEISNFDGGNFLKGVIAVGLMTALVHGLAGVSGAIGPAMLGLLGIGALLAELAVVLALVGQLNKISGFADGIVAAGDLLEKLGTAIGQFIGGLVGGIAQGFTNSLPAIATDLSNFMTEIQPFVDGARDIDKDVIKGVGNLVGAIAAVTAAGFGQKLADWLTIGKTPIEKFAQQIVALGKGMKAYGDEVAGIDAAAVSASAEAAKGLADVASVIPKSGGLANIFTGSDSLLSFAIQLIPFGAALKKYASQVTGLDTNSISNSAVAAKALAEMANVIPNSGGMVAWFTGDNSLASFADQLPKLGAGLKGFSDETAGIVPENITACSNAAKTLAEMMSIIPNTGGMVAWFTGENSVSRFKDDLTALGQGLTSFSNETASINPESIVAASNAAKTLAEMFAVIPNEGGMVAWFTGENSVSRFAGSLKSLGTGLKEFSTETAEIVPENIVAAANAAKALAEMTETIPSEGGMKAWWSGEASVSKFADNLKPLGTGLKDFSTEVAEINPENVTAAAGAAKALAEMVSIIPNEGGMKAWFTGENSMATFADNLPELGKGLKGFSDAVIDIKPENVTAAANAAKALAEMAETTPKDTDKIISFGSNLVSFGSKLKEYFEKTTGITAESIKISKDAMEMVKTATSGFNHELISGASEAIEKMVEALKKMSGVSVESVKGFTEAMAELGKVEVKTIADSFNNASTQLEEIGKNIISKIITGIRAKDPDMVTAGTESATKLGEGLSATNDKLNSSCETLVSNAAEKIKGHRKYFYQAGGSLVEGFANGISQDTWKAEAAAKAMAEAAATAAKNALKINSPSKIFEKIGSGVPEGFVKGVTTFGSSVKNSVKEMTDSAISGAKNILSSIVDSLNMDSVSQPTIRPVLDLSDIQAGAGSIGSMFNNVGIGANLSAVTSSINSRLQNGGNDDVVSAINKLGKVLGSGGDTYNFNGISADGDESVKEAVQTIIRAAKLERRI